MIAIAINKTILLRVFVNNENELYFFPTSFQHNLSVHTLESGKKKRDIPVDIGSISAFSGRKEDTLVSSILSLMVIVYKLNISSFVDFLPIHFILYSGHCLFLRFN